jgi:hypothetical protein
MNVRSNALSLNRFNIQLSGALNSLSEYVQPFMYLVEEKINILSCLVLSYLPAAPLSASRLMVNYVMTT